MDFNSMGRAIASAEGVVMPVRHPNGLPLYAAQDRKTKAWTLTTDASLDGHDVHPCTLRVVSKDTRAFRRRGHEIADEMRKLKDVKAEQAEVEAMRLVMSAVTGWSNIIWAEDGKDLEPLAFNDANLRRFFTGYRAAMEQVDTFCADRANFLPAA